MLTGLLIDGKIQKLRLGCPATYLKNGCDDGLECYTAILILRFSRPEAEQRNENEGDGQYHAALGNGRPHKSQSLSALLHGQRERRQRLEFAVSREDNLISDVGTVLVLTQPKKPSIKRYDASD